MGKLGNGVNTAAIYTQGGGTQLLALDGISQIQWGRVRKDISLAQVDLGAANSKCFSQLGDVHAWQHELVIFRDGARVWEGPIYRPSWKAGSATIRAYDVLGWLKRRRNRAARQLAEGTESPVTTEGNLILTRGFAQHDPNVLAWVQVTTGVPNEARVTRDVAANTVKMADDLSTLGGAGLSYTTIGRRVLLFPDHYLIGRTDTIIPERDMVADVEVVESGDDLATTAAATDTNGLTRIGVKLVGEVNTTTGVSTAYGIHDALIDGSSVAGAASLDSLIRTVLANQYPTPVLINIPGGAMLNCDAPVRMADLVPGTLVPVETSITPRTVSATLILDSVQVTQDKDGEKVAITLAQPSDLSPDA